MLIAIIKDALITVGDYRALFPNTSFRESGPSAEFMAENGCLPVTTWKAHDKTQKLVAVEPYIEDGQVFTVRVESKTAEEIQSAKDSAMANIRGQRNQLLSASDGTQIPDNPNPKKAEWAAYRQALRDLPSKIIAEGTDPRTFSDWPKDPNWVEPQTAS